MAPVPQARQFAYALLATLVCFVAWVQWFQIFDGGMILWAAVGVFVLLVALDWTVQRRLGVDPGPVA